MGKDTFGKSMPKTLSHNLKLMGEQIMLARKRRHLSMQDIADRATVTRLTVSKVEHGDPTVSMGIYARVLFALTLEKDITLIAADDASVNLDPVEFVIGRRCCSNRDLVTDAGGRLG